jgi:Aminoglycoside adenylyltransferase, C-terminal domain
VPRPAILAYLAGELAWGLAHAAEAYAVLNACRALVYLADDRIVSKVEGGELALTGDLAPAALVHRALAQQRGTALAQPPAPDAAAFVQAAAADLAAAASAG